MGGEYLKLEEMGLYNLSLSLSGFAWNIYQRLNYQDRIVMGSQFVRAIDSIGANISEGYGRYHYLDRIKFYYNARGSLFEAKYWSVILYQRQIVSLGEKENLITRLDEINKQINIFIKACYPKSK